MMIHMVKEHPTKCMKDEKKEFKDKRTEPVECQHCQKKFSKRNIAAHEKLCKENPANK